MYLSDVFSVITFDPPRDVTVGDLKTFHYWSVGYNLHRAQNMVIIQQKSMRRVNTQQNMSYILITMQITQGQTYLQCLQLSYQ